MGAIHGIYNAFDDAFEVTMALCDASERQLDLDCIAVTGVEKLSCDS